MEYIHNLSFEEEFKNFNDIKDTFNQRSFNINIVVNKLPKNIYNNLKIDNLTNVHPLIKNIEKIKESNSINYYKITDSLKWIIPIINITFNFETIYYAAQEINIINDNKIILKSIALAKMGIKIKNKILINEKEGRSEIIEKTIVNCNPILLNYTYEQAKDSHQKMLEYLLN